RTPPKEYDALTAKYLPEAQRLAEANVERCNRSDGKRGAHPAAGMPLERDATVLDVEVNCWSKSGAQTAIEFGLGDDPLHGTSLKSRPSDIPIGGFAKKRYMLR